MVVDEESVDVLPAYKEVVPGRALVRVGESLERWSKGGLVAFPVPQHRKTYTGLVERMDEDAMGNRSYVGFVDEAGRKYRFVVTAGPRNTFARLGTPKGTFELVASADLGWLMPTAGMDQHVDYGQPDYMIDGAPAPRRDPRDG